MRRSWVQDVRVSAVVIFSLAEHPDNAMRGRQTRPADLPWWEFRHSTCVARVSGCSGKWKRVARCADRLAGLGFIVIYLCRRKVKEK